LLVCPLARVVRARAPGFPPRLIAFFSLLLLILFFTGSLPFGSHGASAGHGGPGDEVANRRGQAGLLRSKLHTGTGARMQRVVRKALSGAPLTISVLGASSASDPLRVRMCERA
jgi:hypothetical protein